MKISPLAYEVWRDTHAATRDRWPVRLGQLRKWAWSPDDVLVGWDELIDAGMVKRPGDYSAGVEPVGGFAVDRGHNVWKENPSPWI